MTSQKKIFPFIHVIAWAVCLSIPILIYNNPYGEFLSSTNEKFGVPEIIAYSSFIGFFYLNSFLLIPQFFSKKKIVLYAIITLLIILTIGTMNATLVHVYRQRLPPLPPRPFIAVWLYRLFICLANLALSTSYRMIMDNLKRERQIKEKEKENLIAELSFLRSQISPHFIFNILNNVVSLVRKKSEQAEPVLIQLSNLMRYMLYESDSEKVNVKTMLMYANSYINLQKMRFGDDVKIDFKIEDNTVENNLIEPMLLIPLIENAFKHGVEMVEQPEIKGVMTVNKENIQLFVTNRYKKTAQLLREKKSGIGLTNLKRRLNLLYPGKHLLMIDQKENEYTATLKIILQ